jgi:hypothetical protein
VTRGFVVMFVVMATTAHAEPARSYKKQAIIVDVAGIAATAVGLLEVGKAGWHGPVGGGLMAAGITTYFVGGPVVHGVNGNPVLRSVGLRLAPIALGFLVIGLAHDCEGTGHECAFDGVVEGAASLLITVPVALAIDWFVFSNR